MLVQLLYLLVEIFIKHEHKRSLNNFRQKSLKLQRNLENNNLKVNMTMSAVKSVMRVCYKVSDCQHLHKK